jgi:hypothetical protein
MADTYHPGMEFQSWRSMPRLRDQIGTPIGMLIGGAIDALSGSNVGTDMMTRKKVENAANPADFVNNLNIMQQPVVPPSYAGQGKFPSAYQTQEDLTQAAPVTTQLSGLPALPSINAQPTFGGYRKFLDLTPSQ